MSNYSYWTQLADRIEKAIPEKAEPHGLFLHPVDWKHVVMALRSGGEPENYREEIIEQCAVAIEGCLTERQPSDFYAAVVRKLKDEEWE